MELAQKVTRICHFACLMIMVLAMTVRCLIPAGFMPGQGEGFSLVICTANGVETVRVDADYNPVSGHGGEQAPPDCPFAPVLAHGALADAPPVPAAPLVYRLAEFSAPRALYFPAETAVYAAQAPPAGFSI